MRILILFVAIVGMTLATAAEIDAGCRRAGRGGLLSRVFHRGTSSGGCASCR